MNVNAGRYLNEHKEKMQISGIYLGALALIYFLYWIFYIDLCSGQVQPDTFLKELSNSIGD